ncbi:MAG: hypothetical protein DHS20C15_30520 [Planctomycetota bacterium]|nr:MAG: hypothetical protein DHS20C15_30520 [Planctomycetota bacterium]
MTFRESSLSHVRLGVALPVLLGASLLPGFAPARLDDDVESSKPAIADTRSALSEWVATRRLLSQEKRDWVLGREVLVDRIEVMGAEIDSFRERVGEAEATIAETDAKRAELFDENEALKLSATELAATVLALETRTRTLLARLPDPIREKVKPLSQRFPEDPADTKLGLGERFQNIVGVLNEVNKFHGEITLASEVRRLPDGSSVEVTSLYLGVSQGYYANASGTLAGVGSAGPDGWSWRPANQAAAKIRQAIAIAQAEQPAAFVPLPMHIDQESGS